MKIGGKMRNEHNLTPDQIDKLATRLADLRIQSMLFDMDIDWELLTLCEKTKHSRPDWLTSWKEKIDNGDNQPEFDVDLE